MEIVVGIILIIFAFVVLLPILKTSWADIHIRRGRPPVKEMLIAFKVGCGAGNMARFFKEVRQLMPDSKIVRMYFTKGPSLDQPRVHFAVGAVLSEGHCEAPLEQIKYMMNKGYMFFVLPQVRLGLYTIYSNKYKWSIAVAVRRVYPRLFSYMTEHNVCGHPMIEVYGKTKILFYVPLTNQERFYPFEGMESDDDSESD